MLGRLASNELERTWEESFIHQWLYSPVLGLGRFFNFVNVCTVVRTLWTGDQPVTLPLPIHRTTQTQNNAHRHPRLEWDPNPRPQRSSRRRHLCPRMRRHCDRREINQPWYKTQNQNSPKGTEEDRGVLADIRTHPLPLWAPKFCYPKGRIERLWAEIRMRDMNTRTSERSVFTSGAWKFTDDILGTWECFESIIMNIIAVIHLEVSAGDTSCGLLR
jgi:hypothetical protein